MDRLASPAFSHLFPRHLVLCDILHPYLSLLGSSVGCSLGASPHDLPLAHVTFLLASFPFSLVRSTPCYPLLQKNCPYFMYVFPVCLFVCRVRTWCLQKRVLGHLKAELQMGATIWVQGKAASVLITELVLQAYLLLMDSFLYTLSQICLVA